MSSASMWISTVASAEASCPSETTYVKVSKVITAALGSFAGAAYTTRWHGPGTATGRWRASIGMVQMLSHEHRNREPSAGSEVM
eukprot:8085276-Pyramimonas_sp.AAC.2